MDDKLARIAALAGANDKIVDKLEQVLSGPNDRAFVVCSFSDCESHNQGRCTIYTVLDVPRMQTGRPCQGYRKLEGDAAG